MLSPRTTPTRDVVGLDGLWRFALDTAAGAEPWTGAPGHGAGGAGSSELQRPLRRLGHPRPRRCRLVPARRARAPRLDGRADRPALRLGDPRGRRLRERPPGGRARRWLHTVRGRPHRHGGRGRGVPPHRRRGQPPHQRDDPAGLRDLGPGWPREADLLPRLLQLRGHRPFGEALQHPRVLRRRHHRRHGHRTTPRESWTTAFVPAAATSRSASGCSTRPAPRSRRATAHQARSASTTCASGSRAPPTSTTW